MSAEHDHGSLTRTDPRWEKLAATEPYFAILTAPQFRSANLNPGSLKEFFDTGEVLVSSLFRTIENRFDPAFAPASILEYGCGVGRLAIPLARIAATVVAVDRSPVMLEAARKEAARHNVSHIEFRTPLELFDTPRKFDFIVCYSVCQRIPEEDGLELVRALTGLLGPGGIAAIQVPFLSTRRRSARVSDWLRTRIPGANGLANMLLGKPLAQPFFRNYIYSINDTLDVLAHSSVSAAYLSYESHEGFESVIIFAQSAGPDQASQGDQLNVPRSNGSAPPEHHLDVAHSAESIDVRRLIADTSIEELNRRADYYFSSMTDWEQQLTKPFGSPEQTPKLLMDIAVVLDALKVSYGMTVLEFGAGTGWLSRYLTQMGCRVILVDVSETALQMARETYVRLPIIGERPAPEFVLFDGHRLNVPDGSVERIVAFHAFHHVPNPGTVIAEFGRALAPGGIAAFIEPGPRHSQSEGAQFEMRTYGVVENDVNVHDLWRVAKDHGFARVKVNIFNGVPFSVSLDEFEDFLAGGTAASKWSELSRQFARHVRTFSLMKEGAEPETSRSVVGLACKISASGVSVPESQPISLDVTVTNTGSATWLPSFEPIGGVRIGAHLCDEHGVMIAFSISRAELTSPSRAVTPGETVKCSIQLPIQSPGRYWVELDCVAERVAWFAQHEKRQDLVLLEVRTDGKNGESEELAGC